MSRLLTALLACVVVTLLLAVAGCGDQTETEKTTPEATATTPSTASGDDWSSLLAEVRTLEDENAALETELGELMDGLDFEDPSPEAAAAALPRLKDARAVVGEAKENFASLTALWDEMARLNISEQNNTYAGQQKKIAELDARTTVLMDKIFATLEDMLSHLTTLSVADSERLQNRISDLSATGNGLEMRINELKQASEQYYNEHLSE